ncbi:MAG: hypothetical protein RI935_86 [Candidatus Parcubacteria bacterium]|jgi:penicillin-binding protein 2
MNLFRHISTRRARVAASHEIDPEDVFLDSTNLSDLDTNQFQGQLEKPLHVRSFYGSFIIVMMVMSVFSYRLFSMQIVEGDVYKEKADNNHLRTIPLFPLRGTISDRNGQVLAWNSVFSSTSTTSIASSSQEIPKREYVKTPGFSHILGYVSYPKKDQSGVFWQQEYVGKDGVEKYYNTRLSGVKGERIIEVTARKHIESQNVVVYPTNGENITLAIDFNLQTALYNSIASLAQEVGFLGGAGAVMDIHSGEILALTNYPGYDNNLITNASSEEENKKVAEELTSKKEKFLDRAVSGLYVPGSTVKPFFAYAALMEKVITPEQYIYSSGALVIKNKYGGKDTVFKDWKPHGYVNMREAIAASSDEYFYQVGGGYKDQKGVGIVKLKQYAELFGFGTTTGIDLPDENHGVIPDPEWKKKLFNEDWLVGNTYHSSIGQYGFQMTPLELLRATASLANGGYLVTPRVILGGESNKIALNLDPKALKVIQEGMRMAVTEDIGTAKGLRIDGIEIAAKTGTAELGITKQQVNSWVTGYFPYKEPKYAFVVVMEKGKRSNLKGATFAARETLLWMRDNTDYLKK